MLKKNSAQTVADLMDKTTRKLVQPFVLANAALGEAEFKIVASARFDDLVAKHKNTRGDAFEDLDKLWMAAVWRAMWDEYHSLKATGGTGSKEIK